MRAEFRSDELSELPELTVIADNEIEWRALQLYLRLMECGRRSVSVAYEHDEASKEVGDGG